MARPNERAQTTDVGGPNAPARCSIEAESTEPSQWCSPSFVYLASRPRSLLTAELMKPRSWTILNGSVDPSQTNSGSVGPRVDAGFFLIHNFASRGSCHCRRISCYPHCDTDGPIEMPDRLGSTVGVVTSGSLGPMTRTHAPGFVHPERANPTVVGFPAVLSCTTTRARPASLVFGEGQPSDRMERSDD